METDFKIINKGEVALEWNLKKTWTVYILQHSHTDIGYTDRQEEIMDYHIHYIKEAIDILNSGQSEGFKWICEGLWGVEQFWQQASEAYRRDFIRYVKEGSIGLSGNYLNMTEAISSDVLRAVLKKAQHFCRENGLEASSAMTADINGYSWGYADILAENGVKNLISFIHTHHGGYPMGKTQSGFWWVGPKGNRVLSWVGEHYNIGNWSGLCPAYGESPDLWLAEAERLLPPYIEKLDQSDYPFNFCPLAVSGVFTDNAPPNEDIPHLADVWNKHYGDRITLKMATLDEFFHAVRESGVTLPVYRGDWTDWWADGIASTPLSLKLFRDAQRKYTLVSLLDPAGQWTDDRLQQEAAYNSTMYAEHTWGYSSSVREPWDDMVNELDARKAAYATSAHVAVCKNLERIFRANGKQFKQRKVSQTYAVINPYDTVFTDYIYLLHSFERDEDKTTEVVDEETGAVIPHQHCQTARSQGVGIALKLQPHEKRLLHLQTRVETAHHDPANIIPDKNWFINEQRVETPFYTLLFSKSEGGLISIKEKSSGLELLRRDRVYPAFVPIYEITEVTDGRYCEVRASMLQNRRSDQTKRTIGHLKNIDIQEYGILRSQLKLCYDVDETSFFELLYTFYKDLPRFDVSVRMNKNSVWEPENLYISLPFTKAEDELWIEKTGAVLRPGIDQLPGSCIDFYSIQNGLAFIGKKTGVAVACPDTPLIWLGKLDVHPYMVYEGRHEHNRAELYSWVMNNFWETNFKAPLGGFYEFTYHFTSGADIQYPQKAISICEQMNTGAVVFQI